MARHSKWHNIQKRKGAVDAKRAGAFTKLSKAITVAAKQGGEDTSFNVQLRVAIDAAKAANMPKDKIAAAIARGVGGTDAAELAEVVYEGFGPGGVALVIRCFTDNRNRTVADIKHLVSKQGGSIGAEGSVMWMFERKGVVTIVDPSQISDVDAFQLQVIDAGAEDVREEDGLLRVVAPVASLKAVVDAAEASGAHVDGAEIEYLPTTPHTLADTDVKLQLDAFVETIEAYDDVDTVFTNEA